MNHSTPQQSILLNSDDKSASLMITPNRGAIISSWTVDHGTELLFQHHYFWDEKKLFSCTTTIFNWFGI